VNVLPGKIHRIQTSEQISLVDIRVSETDELRTIILESPDSAHYLKAGHDIQVLFKETETILVKGSPGSISISNRLKCSVDHIETGKLVSVVGLNYNSHLLESIITTEALQELDVSVGDQLMILIESNEIMLSV
jgi:molybdopterin-binding protein